MCCTSQLNSYTLFFFAVDVVALRKNTLFFLLTLSIILAKYFVIACIENCFSLTLYLSLIFFLLFISFENKTDAEYKEHFFCFVLLILLLVTTHIHFNAKASRGKSQNGMEWNIINYSTADSLSLSLCGCEIKSHTGFRTAATDDDDIIHGTYPFRFLRTLTRTHTYTRTRCRFLNESKIQLKWDLQVYFGSFFVSCLSFTLSFARPCHRRHRHLFTRSLFHTGHFLFFFCWCSLQFQHTF